MSYKRLGDYITETAEFNDNNKIKILQGVSNRKYFQKAKTNTIGIDLSKYRVAHYNQFVFNRATTRNSNRISIALRKDESCIVSPSYRIFEVKDENVLDPDYLLLWFKRPEFDRYARFKSHGSAHEFFDMSEMKEVELPIPSIEKQQELVSQYHTISDKIKVNAQICKKLETTAQTLYKHWFVDFEFPDEEGKPYKSSGGKMVFNEEMEKEIPEGWEVVDVKNFCDEMKNGATPSRDNLKYWSSRDIPWLKTGEISNNVIFSTEEYISELGHKNSSTKLIPKDSVLMAMYGATAAKLAYTKFETTTNQACCAMICYDKNKSAFLYYALLNQQKRVETMAIGGAQPNLSKQIIEDLQLVLPIDLSKIAISKFSNLIDMKATKTLENQKLTELQSLLLSRLANFGSVKIKTDNHK